MSSITISQPRPVAGPEVARPQQGSSAGLMERRAQLEGHWRARLERVTELSLAYHDAAQLIRDSSPAARLRAARRARLLARRTVTERQALAEIEAALDRIANDSYGWCEQCREPISAALLAKQPQARYCATCGSLAPQRTA
jgi:DnaK suppressor protein